jgi:serine/threonine-protein kinase
MTEAASAERSVETAARANEGFSELDLLKGLLVDRVRLYFKVTFLINVFFFLVRVCVGVAGLIPEETRNEERSLLWIVTVTAGTGLVWFMLTRSRPPWKVAIGLETVGTLVLTAHYSRMIFSVAPGVNQGQQFVALMLGTVVLVLRSALIPSPTGATAVLGCAVVAGVVVRAVVQMPDLTAMALVWLGALGAVVVAVTTLTSSTIYGLQRQMVAAKRLGQYQLERKLGEGGMGQVFLARHSMLQRKTAVKLLTQNTSEVARARFRREVQTASGLSHPNTIEIYDYGRTPEGAFYFAMEYVEGATLEAVVRATGPMPANRVLHLLKQAAGSLGEAHARGLIHRDIKPQNLMLCERGGEHDTVKVLDFGLVRELATAVEQATDDQLSGTPLYLAPEAILAADGFITESDVYALAAVGYFLLAGRPPFSGSLLDVLADHLHREPAPLPSSEEVPELAGLLLRCLSKDPTKRPHTASALRAELELCETARRWSHQDAAVWWAEHRDVVAHRVSEQEATLGSADYLSVGRSAISGVRR